jgi:hypothetical protein
MDLYGNMVLAHLLQPARLVEASTISYRRQSGKGPVRWAFPFTHTTRGGR